MEGEIRHRGEQSAVAQSGVGNTDRKVGSQDDNERDHERRGHEVDHVPGGCFGNEAGEGSGQHDATEKAAHDVADDATARCVRRHMGGKGNKYLDGNRCKADAERCQKKHHRCRGQCRADQSDRRDGDERQHKSAVFQEIAERNDQQKAEAVADLRQGDDQAGCRRCEAEGCADRAGERLAVIEIGRDQSTGGRKKKRH